ncbi:TIGR04282 family arsenosugar biosynthesis glycosyltransferase [Saprospiraceae bacterium]
MTHKPACLIIFVKNPVAGKVKSRIAATTGTDKALEIYLQLQEVIRSTVCQLTDIQKVVYYSDEICHTDEWENDVFVKRKQKGANLGMNGITLFAEYLRHHRKVVLIGSDCPYITVNIIRNAFSALSDSGVVIGPAVDGGYYLIGMKVPHNKFFENINWSTEHVFAQTKERIDKLKVSLSLVEKLSDIDTEQDWLNWTATITNN